MPMTPITKKAQKTFDKLLAGLEYGGAKTHRKIEGMVGMMPISAEVVGKNLFAVSHTYIQNGDVMFDPEVVFFRAADGRLYPARYRQDNLRIDYALLYFEGERVTMFTKVWQKDCAKFCSTWAENISSMYPLDNI